MPRPPKSKTHCYDKFFLRKDMENMGHLFEYCNKYCKELFNVDIDELKFLNAFMKSKCRYTMETGHERLLSQAAVDTVEMLSKLIVMEMQSSLKELQTLNMTFATINYIG